MTDQPEMSDRNNVVQYRDTADPVCGAGSQFVKCDHVHDPNCDGPHRKLLFWQRLARGSVG